MIFSLVERLHQLICQIASIASFFDQYSSIFTFSILYNFFLLEEFSNFVKIIINSFSHNEAQNHKNFKKCLSIIILFFSNKLYR